MSAQPVTWQSIRQPGFAYLVPRGYMFSSAGPFVYPEPKQETRVETPPEITISGVKVLKVDL